MSKQYDLMISQFDKHHNNLIIGTKKLYLLNNF